MVTQRQGEEKNPQKTNLLLKAVLEYAELRKLLRQQKGIAERKILSMTLFISAARKKRMSMSL
jgi:hypothetical protein